jgi:hypothetical protein
MVRELAHLLEPWKTLYADSKAVSTAVTGSHILALLVGGGLAIAADRSTLRALRRTEAERTYQVGELRAVHRPVLIALAVLFVTGVLLAASDVETYATSKVFLVKMGLVALLLVNGSVLYRTEKRLTGALDAGAAPPDVLWPRLRWTARASLALWLLTAAGGAVLAGIA